MYSWGVNSEGQLGMGDRITRTSPCLIKDITKEFVIEISSGNCHSLALNDNGKVFTWGKNQGIEGQRIFDSYGKTIDYQNLGVNLFKPRQLKEVLG